MLFFWWYKSWIHICILRQAHSTVHREGKGRRTWIDEAKHARRSSMIKWLDMQSQCLAQRMVLLIVAPTPVPTFYTSMLGVVISRREWTHEENESGSVTHCAPKAGLCFEMWDQTVWPHWTKSLTAWIAIHVNGSTTTIPPSCLLLRLLIGNRRQPLPFHRITFRQAPIYPIYRLHLPLVSNHSLTGTRLQI